jgi:hypothetical protein
MPFPKSLAGRFVPPCIPTRAPKPPSGPDWVHEIKHEGYRLQVHRHDDTVRLFTRRGYDWNGRYPAIVMTAMQLRATSFTLDGEAVVRGLDGITIFDALHRHGTVSAAMLYAFDLLGNSELKALRKWMGQRTSKRFNPELIGWGKPGVFDLKLMDEMNLRCGRFDEILAGHQNIGPKLALGSIRSALHHLV